MIKTSQHFSCWEKNLVESFQLRKQTTNRQEMLDGEHASLGMWETANRHSRVVQHGNGRNVSWSNWKKEKHQTSGTCQF